MKNLQVMIGRAALLSLMLGAVPGGSLMAATSQVKLGSWYTSGPLKAQAFNEVLFPEKGVDLTAKNPAGAALWTPQPQWTDGKSQELPQGDGRVSTYLFRTLTTDKPAQASVGLGSDDGLEVWLNSKKLLSQDVARGVSPDSAIVVLDLQPGENQLLLKIHNQSGNHGFYFALGACQSRLAPSSAKDFPALRGVPSTREALEDMLATHGDKFPKGKEFLGRLTDLEKSIKDAETALAGGDQGARPRIQELANNFAALQREAMLANPLMNFDKLLLIKRGAGNLGLPQNWQANCGVGSTGYDNEIAVLSPVSPQGNLTTLMKPTKSEFVGDLKLDFGGDKMLFSM
ncbi:MAG: hypothetical protein NTW21_35000, partial [Verrucomicrobia bacterium]|nr:hypothetical protein [Verrucomicrobiota bacterium]